MNNVLETTIVNPKSSPGSSPLSLLANFSWVFAGNIVYAGCQWGILVILAKTGTPEIVGQFALGLAVTAPIIMFSNLQLRLVQATDARGQYVFGDYLGLRLVMTVLALLVIAGTTLVSGYRAETSQVILLVGLAKAVEAVSDAYFGLFQQRERMDRIAISRMINGPLSLVALGVVGYLTSSVVGAALGLLLARTATLVSYDIPNAKSILRAGREAENSDDQTELQSYRPRWDPPTLFSLAMLALPLGIVTMLISLNTNIPRFLIERYQGEHALGIYAAMAYVMVAGQLIESALGQSASPRLAGYYAAGDYRSFGKLLLKLIGVAVVIGGGGVLIAILAGREILTLLYEPEYAERIDVFIWIMLAAGIRYIASFLNYAMTAAGRYKVQTPLIALVALATFLLSLLMIPTEGLLGAAKAFTFSAIIQMVGGLTVIFFALQKTNDLSDTSVTEW